MSISQAPDGSWVASLFLPYSSVPWVSRSGSSSAEAKERLVNYCQTNFLLRRALRETADSVR